MLDDLEAKILSAFDRIQGAVLALLQRGNRQDRDALKQYLNGSAKIHQRGELASMAYHLMECPLSDLAALLMLPPEGVEFSISEPQKVVRDLESRARRCAKGFMFVETIRMNLSYRQIASTAGDRDGVRRSVSDMRWRLLNFFRLANGSGPDPYWAAIKDCIQYMKTEELQTIVLDLSGSSVFSGERDFRVVECNEHDPARGDALRFFRTKLGWSQRTMQDESVARRVGGIGGVARSVIQRAEAGQPMEPATIVKLMQLLGVSHSDMLSRMSESISN